MLMAVGWSLGANILVTYLGEEKSDTPLVAAASLCNPFDLVSARIHSMIRDGYASEFECNTIENGFETKVQLI